MGSSWTRDGTLVLSIRRQILNHWTPREVLLSPVNGIFSFIHALGKPSIPTMCSPAEGRGVGSGEEGNSNK